MRKIYFFFCLILLLFTTSLIEAAGIQLKLTASRLRENPRIDGRLDDKTWKDVPVFSEFRMVHPKTGDEPTEKTELRLGYTSKSLYIGIRCWSTDPDHISVNTMKYDQNGQWSNGDDTLKILIDPFLDMRNAYVFIVNPKGAQTDGLASGEHFSANWDGIWDAAATIDEKGWTAEMEIPFKTLTFNKEISEWGINVERYISRKMETSRISGISKDSFFYNPSVAARAGDFDGMKQGLGLTFKPYMILSAEKSETTVMERHWKLDGGFDLYKNFTPNLVGVFTYNTDFAETEVDDRQINLTRFSLYFPEKRSFFLEGSDIFSFGSGLHRTFVPFFSRSIGIYDEEYIVPIEYGMKVFGKIGNTNMALLNVKTKDSEWIPGNTFTAGRIYQNLFDQSKAGIIFTKGDPNSPENNTMIGFDFNFSTSKFLKNKNFNAGGWWVYNWNSIREGSHTGYGVRLDYPNDRWDVSLTYNYFGNSLEPGLAYLPRNGVRKISPVIQFKPRPETGLLGKLVRQFRFEFFSTFYLDMDGKIVSSRIFTAPINIKLESGDRFEFNIIPEREVLDEPFELSDDLIFPVGEYTHTRYRFQFHSSRHRPLDLALTYTFGSFYSGNLTEFNIGSSFKHNGNFKANVHALFLRGEFPEGRYTRNLFRVSSDIFLNPDIGLMGLLQFDNNSNEMGINLRFKWRLSPGNFIYLVYNRNWERIWDPAERFNMINDLGIFKIQLSVRP